MSHARTIEIIRGRSKIQDLLPLVERIAGLWGQESDATDLLLALIRPDALKKSPILLLIRSDGASAHVDGYIAASLLFEYETSFQLRTRIFSSSDSSGRRNLFAAAEDRPTLAALICSKLLVFGAQTVHLAFCQADKDFSVIEATDRHFRSQPYELAGIQYRWAIEEKETFSYLPLLDTFDKTLAGIGKKTRFNLRYYRRLVERDLGCSFTTEFTVGPEEFLEFNRSCMYARSSETAAFRHHSLLVLDRPYFCGIKDASGRWLAMAGGRRRPDGVEVDWQMNRDGLSHYSISTVLRSYLIEDEIARGSTRFYIDEGTPQAIGRSFKGEYTTALTVCRRSLLMRGVTNLIGFGAPEKNFVRQALLNKNLVWQE